jgi:hypothetical protein
VQIIHEPDATARTFIGNLIFICFWDLVFLQLFGTVQILLLLCQKALIPVQITFTARVFLFRILVESQIYTRKIKISQIFWMDK